MSTRAVLQYFCVFLTVYVSISATPTVRTRESRYVKNEPSWSQGKRQDTGSTEGNEGSFRSSEHFEWKRQLRDSNGGCPPMDLENVRVIDFEKTDGGTEPRSVNQDDVFPGPTIVMAQKRGNDGYEDGKTLQARYTEGDDFDLFHFSKFLGRVLVIAEDSGRFTPTPAAEGGKVVFTFPPTGVLIHSIRFIDTGNDGDKSDVTLYSGVSRQDRIKGFKVPHMRDGDAGAGQKVVNMCAPNVTAMVINLQESGAIDDIVFSIPPTAIEDEVCCDVADLAGMECPTEDAFFDNADADGFICCPDGKWSCVYSRFSREFEAVCAEADSGVTMRVKSSQRFGVLESDLATRAPICGGGCDSLDFELILAWKLPCPQLCNSDRLSCNDQETVVTRNPLNNCEFHACPEVECCSLLRQPRCLAGTNFCCADGNWDCVSRNDLFGPFCRGKLAGHEVPSPICDQCDSDIVVCPNTTLVRERDPEDDCNFQPCPEPQAKCCELKDKPGVFGNPPCAGDGQPECCRDGKWTCGSFSDFLVEQTGELVYFVYCDTDIGPVEETGGLVCGEEFDPAQQ